MKNFFLSCKEVRIEPTSPKTFYGCFYLGPFAESYALTIANALRRTLLADLTGCAITSVSIEGALHEYATLPGIRETVLDILLNLKEVVLKNNGQKTSQKSQLGYLQMRGPGIVRAGDLKLPPGFQCVDPEQYIATLSEDGKFNCQFMIDEGKNFVFQKNPFTFSTCIPTEEKKQNNWLSIDAIFTPIKKVNYTIRSLGSESLEKENQIVVLEVWTNGSLDPKEAISKALNILRLIFNQLGELKVFESVLTTYSLNTNFKFRKVFTELSTDLELAKLGFYKQKSSNHKNAFTLLQSFDPPRYSENLNEKTEKANETSHVLELGLPYPLLSKLLNANIQTISDLKKLTESDFKKMPGFTLELILLLKTYLKKHDIFLNDMK